MTAQKRSENLEKVPISVAVISGEQLSAESISTVRDLRMTVPGLMVQDSFGTGQQFLRGVGTGARGVTFENPIATYVDGVYIATASASLLSFNNVSDVQVLKGPQGTLFGRNATGGLIQVTTRDPSHDFGGQFDIGYGNYETTKGDLYVTGGITDTLAADFAFTGSTAGEGWGNNLYNGRQIFRNDHDLSYRSKWLFTPQDSTRVTLIVDHVDSHNSNDVFRLVNGTLGAPGTTPAHYPSPWDADINSQPQLKLKTSGVSLRIEQNLGSVTFNSISAYHTSRFDFDFDQDAQPLPLVAITYPEKDHWFSEELQLQSNHWSTFDWTVGAYYYKAGGNNSPFDVLIGVPPATILGPIVVNAFLETDSFAGYAQGTVHLNDSTRLTLGSRVTTEYRHIDGTQTEFFSFDPPEGTLLVHQVASTNFTKPTYRIALDHDLTPDVLVYASFNTGIKSGGFNDSTPGLDPFRPESLAAYEVGTKMDLLDHRMRLNISPFYYDYKDVQVERLFLTGIGTINGASAKNYGVDVDSQFQLSDHVRILGSAEFLHATYTSFPSAPCGTPLGGTPVVSCDVTGNHVPNSPDFAASIGGGYATALARGKLDFNAVAYYNDGYFGQPDNQIHQGSYVQLNASLKWEGPTGLSLGLWGNNLTNRAVMNTGDSSSAGYNFIVYGAPRTYGFTIGYKF